MTPRIKLLGTVELRCPDGVVLGAGAFPTVRALDLLRLLAGSGGLQHGADHYIGLLWPHADDSHGRMSLRTAVAQLRRVLGHDVVRRDGDVLSLGEVDSDLAELRRGLAAVEQVRGRGDDAALLRLVEELERTCGAELVVSSGSCEAVYSLGAELRELRGLALLDAAEAASRVGPARVSLDLARRADALLGHEASARAVMLAWSGLGETAQVVETFERLRAGLQAAYGVQPSPLTRALYLEVVTGGDGPGLEPVLHHSELVRALAGTVLELLERQLPGGVVWLEGEPGAGRGGVAREAVRLLDARAPELKRHVLILPEVIVLDEEERQRLMGEALADGSVLLVPLRRPLGRIPESAEVVLTVPPLERYAFRELLTDLLQQVPASAVEERLWSTTGGLAGHLCRTVAQLRGDGVRP